MYLRLLTLKPSIITIILWKNKWQHIGNKFKILEYQGCMG